MRGREGLTVRKLRFLVSPSRGRLGRGDDTSILWTTAKKHLFALDRAPGVDDKFPNPLTTFGKNARTTGVPDGSLSPHPCSNSAWTNKVAHRRPLVVVSSAPADISPSTAASSYEFETLVGTATRLPHARKLWGYGPSIFGNIHRAGCSPRLSCSFATLREQVKVEEEQSMRHEPRPSENPRDQSQDADASIKKAQSGDTETSLGFGRIEQNDVQERDLDRIADKSRGSLTWSEAGWTIEEVWSWPNSISVARLLSGPLLGWMILHELWSPALIGLTIAGISDWLDGYVARKMGINSVLGSYLDPVADKVLVGSVALSMAYAGLLHPALVGLVVARDGVLVGGALVYRAYSLRWQWKNWREFFRINVGGAGKVEPLFISKVNTVLQLGLIGVALVQPALSVDDTYSLVPLLSWSVAGTTTISWACYVYQYLKNPDSLAALRRMPQTHSDKKS